MSNASNKNINKSQEKSIVFFLYPPSRMKLTVLPSFPLKTNDTSWASLEHDGKYLVMEWFWFMEISRELTRVKVSVRLMLFKGRFSVSRCCAPTRKLPFRKEWIQCQGFALLPSLCSWRFVIPYMESSTEVLDANSTQLNAFSKLHCYESDAIIKSGLLIIIISRKPQTSTTRVEHD